MLQSTAGHMYRSRHERTHAHGHPIPIGAVRSIHDRPILGTSVLEVLAPRLPTAALVAAMPYWLAYAREIVAVPTAHKQRLWPLLRMCLAFANS